MDRFARILAFDFQAREDGGVDVGIGCFGQRRVRIEVIICVLRVELNAVVMPMKRNDLAVAVTAACKSGLCNSVIDDREVDELLFQHRVRNGEVTRAFGAVCVQRKQALKLSTVLGDVINGFDGILIRASFWGFGGSFLFGFFPALGVGICWDQWFPETARAMSLMGADVLLYPTAIGSEPQDPTLNSRDHWRRTMQGHAAANMAVLAASNRVGVEKVGHELTFYGGSFIVDETGGMVADMDTDEGVALASFDLEAIRKTRAAWGIFRDRRPERYGAISS